MCCRGVVHAYISIWRGEGLVAGLYRGTAANIARSVQYSTVQYSIDAAAARWAWH